VDEAPTSNEKPPPPLPLPPRPLPHESVPTDLVSDALLSQRWTLPEASPTAKQPRTVEGQSEVQGGVEAATAAAKRRRCCCWNAGEDEEEEEEEKVPGKLGSMTDVACRLLR